MVEVPTWEELGDLRSPQKQDEARRRMEDVVADAEKEVGEAIQAFLNAQTQQNAKVKEAEGKLARFLELVQHQRDVGTPQDGARVERKTLALTDGVGAAIRAKETALKPLIERANATDATYGRARDTLAALKEYIDMTRDDGEPKEEVAQVA